MNVPFGMDTDEVKREGGGKASRSSGHLIRTRLIRIKNLKNTISPTVLVNLLLGSYCVLFNLIDFKLGPNVIIFRLIMNGSPQRTCASGAVQGRRAELFYEQRGDILDLI